MQVLSSPKSEQWGFDSLNGMIFDLRKDKDQLGNIQKSLGPEITRYYSYQTALLIYLLQQSDFSAEKVQSFPVIYAAIDDGTYELETDSTDHQELMKHYGPRQYLKSFSPFVAQGVANFFSHSCSVMTFSSAGLNFQNLLDEAAFDLKQGRLQKALLLGSKKTSRDSFRMYAASLSSSDRIPLSPHFENFWKEAFGE